MNHVYIGTSGWQYKNWKGDFYPDSLPQSKWLRFYSEIFTTVEVNSSFYGQPRASTFIKWMNEVPSDFVFSIKGARFITHIKRLRDCTKPLSVFFENADSLRKISTAHVILWQLPPYLKKDKDRLKRFIDILPGGFRHAFEFRNASWDAQFLEKFFALRKPGLSVVLQDWKEWPMYTKMMGDFVYIRFHGKDQLYASGYGEKELESWSKKMREWVSGGADVYAYFNNDALGFAYRNALTLKNFINK